MPFPERDLSKQFISTSYQDVVQRYASTGSNTYLLDGLGFTIGSIPNASIGNQILTSDQTASFALTASVALNAVTQISTSWASSSFTSTSSSYAVMSDLAQVATVALLADTASISVDSITASYAITASSAVNAFQSISASWAPPIPSNFAISASWASQSIWAISASFASQSISASWAPPIPSNFAVSASWASQSLSASYANTASFASTATQAVSSSFATFAQSTLSASFASQSISASWAPPVASNFAISASWASQSFSATSASFASQSISSSYALTASSAVNAFLATSATSATTATAATSASWASASFVATSASFASQSISASYATQASASFTAVSASWAPATPSIFAVSASWASQSLSSSYVSGTFIQLIGNNGTFVPTANYTASNTSTLAQLLQGSAATPSSSPDAVLIVQKVSSANVQGAFNTSIYGSSTMYSPVGANNSTTAIIGDALLNNGGLNVFIEGVRGDATLTNNTAGHGQGTGGVFAASCDATSSFQYLIGCEAEAYNQSSVTPPARLNQLRFSCAFLATSRSPTSNDAGFLTNPNNTAPTTYGFLAGINSVVSYSFASMASTAIGLDLTQGSQSLAAVAIPNLTPIRIQAFAKPQLLNVQYVDSNNFNILGTDTSASILQPAGGRVGINIGNFLPTATLQVGGNISASVITASLLFGTASFALNSAGGGTSVSASWASASFVATSASFASQSISASWAPPIASNFAISASWASQSLSSSYATTASFVLSNGNVNTLPVGNIIYSSSSFANLNDFTAVGFSPSIVSNAIRFPTGAGDWNQYITLNNPINTDANWEIEVTYTPNTLVSFGLGIGKLSINTFFPMMIKGQLYATASHMYIANNTASNIIDFVDTGFGPTFPGDTLLVRFKQSNNVFSMFGKNVTSGYERIIIYKDPLVSATASLSQFMVNTSKFTIWNPNGAGTIDIKSIKITSFSPQSPNLSIIGDSKVNYSSTNYASSFPQLLSSQYFVPIVPYSGVGDRTAEASQSVNYLINTIKPKNVMLLIGRNDVVSGVTASIWQPNYNFIVNSLLTASIGVTHILPVPESSSVNQTALRTFIINTYGYDKCIDVTANFNTNSMIATDAIHPNATGHQWIADSILGSGLLKQT